MHREGPCRFACKPSATRELGVRGRPRERVTKESPLVPSTQERFLGYPDHIVARRMGLTIRRTRVTGIDKNGSGRSMLGALAA